MKKDIHYPMDIIVRQINSPETKNRFQKIEIIDNMIVGGNILQNSATSKYNYWNYFQSRPLRENIFNCDSMSYRLLSLVSTKNI